MTTHTAQSSNQGTSVSIPPESTFPAERDSDGKLKGWGTPLEFFSQDQGYQTPPMTTPEPIVHPLSYPAIFDNTTGTAFIHKDGVSFHYFDQRTKAMRTYDVSPLHSHMLRPLPQGQSLPPQQTMLATRPIATQLFQTPPAQRRPLANRPIMT